MILKLKKYLKIIFINLLVTFLLVELIAMIFIKVKKPPIPGYVMIPTYLDIIFDKERTFKGVFTHEDIKTYSHSPRNIDTLYPWCTWHPRNNTFREIYRCFDITYKFNEWGIRGPMPNTSDSNTILFIGDSFTEGYGLEEDSTIAARMQRLLNKNIVNLGSAGAIGTTQMSMVYDYFSKKIKHKEVFIFFFLDNDLYENNIGNHYIEYPNRFRPYRVLTGDSSSKIVYRGSLDSTAFTWAKYNKAAEKGFTTFNNNESFLTKLTMLTYTRRLLRLFKHNIETPPNPQKPYELGYRKNDLKIIKMDIASILATASKNNVKVTFTNLPSKYLLECAQKTPAIAKEYSQLETILRQMTETDNSRYISFYDYLMARKINPEKIIFECDPHYNNYAESLLSEFLYQNYPR